MQGSGLFRISGLAGVLGSILGVSAAFISTALCGPGCGDGARAWSEWAPGGAFNWSINALSDLGVSRVSDLFNYSLILVGILNFVFALGFVKAYGKSMRFYMGGGVLILGGASLSLVGIFTEAQGPLHSYVSLGYFVLFPLAMILVGLAFTGRKMNTEGLFSILAGVFSLLVIVSGLALRWHLWLGLGFAVPEIIEAIAIASWISWMGVGLVRLPWKSRPGMSAGVRDSAISSE